VVSAVTSRLRVEKRIAIVGSARRCFAEHGYMGTTIEAIAVGAGVSTRTVYKHFSDKAELFETVIGESASRVADAQLALIDRFFPADSATEGDLCELLTTFAIEWTQSPVKFREHSRLVERVRLEIGQIPPSGIEAWQNAGPIRVRRALAAAFERLSQQGRLRSADPDTAASHFARLITVSDPLRPTRRIPLAEVIDVVTEGVRAFVFGYQTGN
jgi:AcrR family transcriptional regulator